MTQFFYIDESGHTGTNLFDENQPFLYYGIISAKVNLDVLAKPFIDKARLQHGVERLHANELGMKGLVEISQTLCGLQKKYKPTFDMYRVAKADHAIISFFDQVFDQGLNPAMTWSGYWTPLRYVLLLKLASLFDEELAKNAWAARIDLKDETSHEKLVQVCEVLLERLVQIPDARSRQLMGDTLRWASKNPEKLGYNCTSKKDVLSISPNVIGFQSVLHGVARRLGSPKAKASIVVDQQSQFNKSQRWLAEFYAKARAVPWETGPGLPEMNLANIPTAPLQFKAGQDSYGLELVDIYLWIFKKLAEKSESAPELYPLIKSQLNRGRSDDISINAIAARWERWFEDLPEPSAEAVAKGRELKQLDEARRLRAVQDT